MKTIHSIFACVYVVCSAHQVYASQTVVAAHVLDRGNTISAGDLDAVDAASLGNRSNLASYDILLGKELKRTIAAGQPIYNSDIKIPDVIKRDELITMLVSHGGMTIAATGKALESGGKGSNIRVQNVASKQIVEGQIASAGTVIITPLGAPQIPSGY